MLHVVYGEAPGEATSVAVRWAPNLQPFPVFSSRITSLSSLEFRKRRLCEAVLAEAGDWVDCAVGQRRAVGGGVCLTPVSPGKSLGSPCLCSSLCPNKGGSGWLKSWLAFCLFRWGLLLALRGMPACPGPRMCVGLCEPCTSNESRHRSIQTRSSHSFTKKHRGC